ncbi:Histidine biosynthesis trifunctional protein Includes: RecName: Full=Phosphoribosyl-AMP cyclohydrolase; Includes: RecName: Full=Phosphoribosyl-ATP pyrophosphohydrolase; Includes: RecName: Full=Histidinol dehydrogenase; Short=HDH [Serendipita indica DSM 11827]|nr:Histidine biosynthesis trifunctional protein Includes: RecName: Full=Phosphoribosyl-AMP cyclohydrolase; Includes: RecName: Full=Phosphoribosyl-ATP pyrophosphohydrolase; Includes: RecName: Full=Histidinol dehydrogenase; Short=HDH [Serendipita indica DSM 11827]
MPTPPFLPLLSQNTLHDLERPLAHLGPAFVSHQDLDIFSNAHTAFDSINDTTIALRCREFYVVANNVAGISLEQIQALLDSGARKLVLPASPVLLSKCSAAGIDKSRLIAHLDLVNAAVALSVTDTLRNAVSGVYVRTNTIDYTLVETIRGLFPSRTHDLYLSPISSFEVPLSMEAASSEGEIGRAIRTLVHSHRTTLVVPSTALPTPQVIASLFVSALTTDRPDGLYPTVVSSYHGNHSLGLVYSSASSIAAALASSRGVYWSRSRNALWQKGDTSGATQELVHIRQDCDGDALEFVVDQVEPGFCHLDTPSCFTSPSSPLATSIHGGLSGLERTLISRLSSAPEGSYTRRLMADEDLLQKKIKEEADELCAATTKDDIAFEAADLLYFAMVMCLKNGVRLADVERALDKKATRLPDERGMPSPDIPLRPSAVLNGIASKTNGVEAPSTLNGYQNGEAEKIKMTTYTLSALSPPEQAALLRRPVLKSGDMIAKVQPIVERVRKEGDEALKALTKQFDKAELDEVVIRPPFFAPESGNGQYHCLDGTTRIPLSQQVKEAMDVAYQNIKKFHTAQLSASLTVETSPGVICTRVAKPINKVGLYIPGGTAVLPSTALMLGVPAQVAGCKEVVFATPPQRSSLTTSGNATVSPEVLYAAHLVGCGSARVWDADGAKVDKIFGPGNQWVTAAKMLVQNDDAALVGIDMPAGPSEVLVIADSTSDPAFVAADLLSQAEHGVDSQVVLVGVTLSSTSLQAIEAESIAKSITVIVESLDEALAFSNRYAPEHLIVNVPGIEGTKVHEVMAKVENAGSVFFGPYTPESCGDYASGTNHTLPTNGYARQYSGVNTASFQKHITSQEISPDGLKVLGPVVVTLAECEGLEAHANAVRVRLQALHA